MGEVVIINTRMTPFLTIRRALKTAFGQLPPVNLGARRKQKYRVKGSLVIGFLPINRLHLIFNHFK